MTKIVVTSGTKLSEKDIKRIETYLTATYKEYEVKYIVEDSLIGGITIFDGSKVFDASISGQLKRLAESAKGKNK